MKSEDAAKTSHYTGQINVMTVRKVSAYLRVHPTTVDRLLKRRRQSWPSAEPPKISHAGA
jgi:hypothetical protein